MSATSVRRKSSLAAEKRMRSQMENVEELNGKVQKSNGKAKKHKSGEESDFEDKGSSDRDEEPDAEMILSPDSKRTKKRKNTSRKAETTSEPPFRQHRTFYHRPLLLDDRQYRSDLLTWFDSVSTARSMPWRKAWIDPKTFKNSDHSDLRSALERRSYEVWISEIMLQQTRVAVVIDYWNKWMDRWPTIQDLANASADDVLSAWRGLGYYSRATRIHEAAKKVVNDSQMLGLLPNTAEELQAKVPGVGRYTGGAISAIVFGHAEPMVDGNVLRVLARQTGLFTNVKTNKTAIDALWAAADALVKAVAKDHSIKSESSDSSTEGLAVSDGPGRWGQALMELGSTVCTPKPDCANCPITTTCRAYAEGVSLAKKAKLMSISSQSDQPVGDIEDLCSVCEPYEEVTSVIDGESEAKEEGPSASAPPTKPKARQASLAAFAFTSKPRNASKAQTNQQPAGETTKPSAKAMEMIVDHCKKFPVKVIKKAVREEETIVCAIRNKDGNYLINKRPEKGLLAGMWEFPSNTLPDTNDSTSKDRKKRAVDFLKTILSEGNLSEKPVANGELGSVPWLFSHLKLTMHVYLFEIDESTSALNGARNARWASHDEVEAESMGTGMRKCWSLVKERL
ncbi:DNA glycosylase [Meira miltonrushii]|uniref:Adenine DNA glycosylase n=1 Tax=Meira miltonrushii TaxID=1280837 RepID=A0A316VJ29_9BASI|nr:DNA glycosylase [Meira miltonrushii]PWN35505.1 DNA glycosylase [Meira miltonrushii]